MKSAILLIALVLMFVAGCSGTGFEKRTTLVPNSVTVQYMQERCQRESDAWKGVGVSATWEFK